MSCRYGVHKNPEPGKLRNCSFKNIQVVGEQGSFRGLLYMQGNSDKHDVSRLTFERIGYFGRPVRHDSSCVQIGAHVADVDFR
jgi:hypothetical protein